MIGIQVSDYQSFDAALRAFRSKVRRAHIIEIVNKKSHYISPSERKHKERGKKK